MRFEPDLFNGVAQIGRTVKLLIYAVKTYDCKSSLPQNKIEFCGEIVSVLSLKNTAASFSSDGKARLINCGNPLKVLQTTLTSVMLLNTRANSLENGNICKNWAIRMQIRKDHSDNSELICSKSFNDYNQSA
jgi:hypothetical protein